MTALSVILGMLVVLFLVPVTILLVQVLMALSAYQPGHLSQGRRTPVDILIPAHDEAVVIAAALGPGLSHVEVAHERQLFTHHEKLWIEKV